MIKFVKLFISTSLLISLVFNNQTLNVQAIRNNSNASVELQQTNILNLDMANSSETLVDFDTEPMAFMSWAALIAFLLANYPSFHTMVNNFVYGWQTRPGFGSVILTWADSKIKLHFETYTDGTSNYWTNISSGCVIHTRNTYLCPYKG